MRETRSKKGPSIDALFAEVVACKHIVEDYAKRIDEACVEYHETGKSLFPNLSLAEDEDTCHRCKAVLERVASIAPDALNDWETIDYDPKPAQIVGMRALWIRRRNVFRALESRLRTQLELDDASEPQLSQALGELIRTKETVWEDGPDSDAGRAWLARAAATLSVVDPRMETQFKEALRYMRNPDGPKWASMVGLLHEAQWRSRLEDVGQPASVGNSSSPDSVFSKTLLLVAVLGFGLLGLYVLQGLVEKMLWFLFCLVCYPVVLAFTHGSASLERGHLLELYRIGVAQIPFIGKFLSGLVSGPGDKGPKDDSGSEAD